MATAVSLIPVTATGSIPSLPSMCPPTPVTFPQNTDIWNGEDLNSPGMFLSDPVIFPRIHVKRPEISPSPNQHIPSHLRAQTILSSGISRGNKINIRR